LTTHVERRIEKLTEDELPPLPPSVSVGHPYRAALHRTAIILASPVSGRWTATLLIACMSVVAIALPGLLRLPRWIEAELVLASWWAGWAAVLTTPLYRAFGSPMITCSPVRVSPGRVGESRQRTLH
jgi:hypothetical protein